jgi:hypothetical protein
VESPETCSERLRVDSPSLFFSVVGKVCSFDDRRFRLQRCDIATVSRRCNIQCQIEGHGTDIGNFFRQSPAISRPTNAVIQRDIPPSALILLESPPCMTRMDLTSTVCPKLPSARSSPVEEKCPQLKVPYPCVMFLLRLAFYRTSLGWSIG